MSSVFLFRENRCSYILLAERPPIFDEKSGSRGSTGGVIRESGRIGIKIVALLFEFSKFLSPSRYHLNDWKITLSPVYQYFLYIYIYLHEKERQREIGYQLASRINGNFNPSRFARFKFPHFLLSWLFVEQQERERDYDSRNPPFIRVSCFRRLKERTIALRERRRFPGNHFRYLGKRHCLPTS